MKTVPKKRDWKSGDTFALKIKNSKYLEYNDRYLLFIYTGKNQKVTMPIFRIKLTKDNYKI